MQILKDHGVDLDVIHYLEHPPTIEALTELIKKLGVRPKDVVRTKEEIFSTLDLDLENDSAVIKALAEHPVLLQRPIVVHQERAVVARPPEKVKELF